MDIIGKSLDDIGFADDLGPLSHKQNNSTVVNKNKNKVHVIKIKMKNRNTRMQAFVYLRS